MQREPGETREPRPGVTTCRGCVHFQITWDPGLPYGCRALNFKSKRNPAQVVYEASGMECQAYQKRQ